MKVSFSPVAHSPDNPLGFWHGRGCAGSGYATKGSAQAKALADMYERIFSPSALVQ